MVQKPIIPAIWVRFTPYLVAWAEEEYGTAHVLCGRRVLELRSLSGVRQIMREAVEEDDVLSSNNRKSLSQMRFEVVLSVLDARLDNAHVMECFNRNNIQFYLPVHVPNYLLAANGAIRPFSRAMQMRAQVARQIAQRVYVAFWAAVRQYDQANTSFAIDKDMLESYCEDHNIPSIYVDDLRNQYQRLKRQGYFAKKS